MLPMRLTRFIARQTRVRPARVKGRCPVASITFDDFPKSAWETGGRILARFKLRGTYYTAGTFCGRSVDGTQFYDESDLRALAAAGHEIACHGDAHRLVSSQSPREFAEDLRSARVIIERLTGRRPIGYRAPAFSITRS